MSTVQNAFYRLAPNIVDFGVDDEGIIDYADRRFVFFHTAMFAELFKNMRSVTGPVVNREIQEFGEAAGKDIAEKMDAAFRNRSVVDIVKLWVRSGFDYHALKTVRPMDNQSMIEKILGVGTFDGWIGNVTFETYDDGEKAVIYAENTFESQSYGSSEQPQCRFIRGVIKGILAHYWRTDELSVQEEECRCTGHDACKMVITRAP